MRLSEGSITIIEVMMTTKPPADILPVAASKPAANRISASAKAPSNCTRDEAAPRVVSIFMLRRRLPLDRSRKRASSCACAPYTFTSC